MLYHPLATIRKAVAEILVITAASSLPIVISIQQASAYITDEHAPKTARLATDIPQPSHRAIDLGGMVFPEYYNSPFSGWRIGSDEPLPAVPHAVPASGEEIMHLPATSDGVLIKQDPRLEAAPVVRPVAQPAVERIDVIYAP